ncbi:MAG: type VII toxin-antitoxin system MntA family adenylyltransferase antitoxin [bacterium]
MIRFEKIPEDIISRMPQLEQFFQREERVIFAYLFGSLAKGKQRPLADVDIAVYLKTLEAIADYKLELFLKLSDALGTSEIDLVILNTAPISLTGRIVQGRQVIIDKEPFKRHLYESLTLREFFDFQIHENRLLSLRYSSGR